ncbi:MAG: glycoside hydrolase family 3 N-terminal domain-containing protein [Gemmatimonadales bacterium]
MRVRCREDHALEDAVGIHLAFAPDADVNNNPNNPVINTRSFGEDPDMVGRLVAAASIERAAPGEQDAGDGQALPRARRHRDRLSHLALPVINASWNRLDSVELVPFRAAVQAGVSLVMSGHLAMKDLNERPAGARHARPVDPHEDAARLAQVRRDGRHRRPRHGGGGERLRHEGSGGARLPRRLRPAPHAGRSRPRPSTR